MIYDGYALIQAWNF